MTLPAVNNEKHCGHDRLLARETRLHFAKPYITNEHLYL